MITIGYLILAFTIFFAIGYGLTYQGEPSPPSKTSKTRRTVKRVAQRAVLHAHARFNPSIWQRLAAKFLLMVS